MTKSSPNQNKGSKQSESTINNKSTPVKKSKPEDKPFNDFITEELVPGLERALENTGFPPTRISFRNDKRPITGDPCWMVIGELSNGRRFWLCFDTNKISSNKTVAIAEQGTDPSVLESFLIDERKTTKALLISRLLQRLNGQKWLGAN